MFLRWIHCTVNESRLNASHDQRLKYVYTMDNLPYSSSEWL